MSASEKCKKITFYQTIDNLSTWLQKRIDAYTHVLELFACLFTFSENDVDRLVAEYPND